VDVAFDEPEDVGVRAALNLAHELALARREERQLVDERQAVRQIVVRHVERAAADHVVVDVPADALAGCDGTGVTASGFAGFEGGHGCSPLSTWKTRAHPP